MESNPKSTKMRRRTLRTNATASEQSVCGQSYDANN